MAFRPRGQAQRESFEGFFASPVGRQLQKARKARWERRQASQAAQLRSTDPASWVQVDPGLSVLVRTLLERAAPAVVNAVNRRFVPVFVNAQRQWPFKTGLSLSLLSLEYEVLGGDTFAATIRSAAPYTAFINKFDTANQLIILPGEFAANQMADDIAEELAL